MGICFLIILVCGLLALLVEIALLTSSEFQACAEPGLDRAVLSGVKAEVQEMTREDPLPAGERK